MIVAAGAGLQQARARRVVAMRMRDENVSYARISDRPHQRIDMVRVGRSRIEDRQRVAPDQERVGAVKGERARVRCSDTPHSLARGRLPRPCAARRSC